MANIPKELVQKRGLRIAQIIVDARRIPRDYGPPKGTPRQPVVSGSLRHTCRWCATPCQTLVAPTNKRVPIKRNGRVIYQPLQQGSILKCESLDGHLSISLREFTGQLAWKSGSVFYLDDPWVEARDVWGAVARVRRAVVRNLNSLSAEAKTWLVLCVIGVFALISRLFFLRASQMLPGNTRKANKWALDHTATAATVVTTIVACAILLY